MRGIMSMANAFTLREASFSTSDLFCAGYRKEIIVLPSFKAETSSSGKGGRTFSKTSVFLKSSSLETKVAPALA